MRSPSIYAYMGDDKAHRPAPLQPGTVVWVHPKGRFYVVEFDLPPRVPWYCTTGVPQDRRGVRECFYFRVTSEADPPRPMGWHLRRWNVST